MCCIDKRRKRLLKRKVFKNHNNWSYEDCFVAVILAKCFIIVFIALSLITDCYRNNGKTIKTKREDAILFWISYIIFYSSGLFLIVIIVFFKVPEKYFRLCSVLSVIQVFLIVFFVFHLFQTFVPGPRTGLEEIFKFSFYAAFIWIPALVISLFSCAIILWTASDQSELYTVILDGKRSSTKNMDP
ncbi:unnamed protein product [Caenorhabditis brenneri]